MVRAWTELGGIFFLLKWFIPGVWLFIFKFYHFIKSSERKFWILKNSEFLLFDGGPMHTRDVRTISSCYCPTIFTFLSAVQKPFIFWVVFQHCLRSTLHFMFLSNEGPTLKMLDCTFYICSTKTFLYFDLYFNTAYAAHNNLCFSLTKSLRSKCCTLLSTRQYTNLFIFRFVSENCLRTKFYVSLWQRAYVQTRFLYRRYTNLFVFRFVTHHAAHYILCFSLTKGLRSKY